MEADGKSTTIHLDIMKRSEQLLIDLDIKRHSDTINREDPSYLAFRRPRDTGELAIRTQIREEYHGNALLWMEVVITDKLII